MKDQDYHRSYPPREVSYFTQIVIFLGGTITQLGWFLSGFGLIFFWVFGLQSQAMNWFEINKRWVPVEGEIRKIERTDYSENDNSIYAIYFVYKIDGVQYGDKNYSTAPDYDEGEIIEVQYNKRQPEEGRIYGERTKPFGAWVMLVIIFPLIGLFILVPLTTRNIKSIDLLRNGYFTRGRIIHKRDTGSSITIHDDRNPIYEYEFEYEAEERTYTTTCKTHLTELVEDDEEEIILYSRSNPGYSVVYDTIPNVPVLDAYGNLSPVSRGRATVLIIPLVSIIINGLTFWFFIL